MTVGRRVVVVGGGPGGLCAAMLLQHRGFQVTLLEKQDRFGGRSGHLRLGGFTFDVGSTLLMMRFVLEEMFELVGRRLDDAIELVPIDPMYHLDFGDRALDVYSDPERMRAELARFAPGSERGLRAFLEGERARIEHLYPVLQRTWPHLHSLASRHVLGALPYVGLHQTLHDVARRYFADEALQLGFSFQSAYLGMSPWECPGGFGMVPYVEHAWGIDHVRGGIHRIADAMASVAADEGATLRLGADVKRLVVRAGTCEGVELETGERVPADHVVINADATEALLRLLDQDVSPRFGRRRVANQHESCSTFMLYLGLDTKLPLAHHTFFFARDYRAEMQRLFHGGTLGDDHSLYVCNPAATDDSMAPPGKSSLYVLALVPNLRSGIDWQDRSAAFQEQVLDRLEARTGLDVRPHVERLATMTPADWSARYDVSNGAVFGPSHRIDQMLAFRAPNRLPHPHNVYLAGGGTNPGSGLPTILESGRLATRLLCEEAGIAFPPSRPLLAPAHA